MVPAAQIRGHRAQYGPDSGLRRRLDTNPARSVVNNNHSLDCQHGALLTVCEDDDLLQVEVGGLHLSAGLELLQLVYHSQTSQK